jgi:hypothetical protein
MPKLNATHLPERIRTRLEQLRSGVEVAQRDLRAVLTLDQAALVDTLWAEQQALRKNKRARTEEEKTALGWKSKREIHIEVLEQALREAEDDGLNTIEKELRRVEVMQVKIYLEAINKYTEAGHDMQTSKRKANNDLTRANFRRLDGASVRTHGLSKRDRDIRELEEAILQRVQAEMTPEEREQHELAREGERAVVTSRKKRPR